MRSSSVDIVDVQQWNDEFARENDIDAYYTRASVLIRWVTRRRLSVIKKLLNPNPTDQILEVGCGGGHILQMFPRNELVGIDVSGEMIRKCERNLGGYNVTLYRGELHELPLRQRSFDRMICSEVLEHVVNPNALLEQMARLLAPGGKLVLTIPNDKWIDAIKAFIRRSGLRWIPPFRRIAWGGDKYHLHSWSASTICEDLSRHFQVETIRQIPMSALPLHFAISCRAN